MRMNGIGHIGYKMVLFVWIWATLFACDTTNGRRPNPDIEGSNETSTHHRAQDVIKEQLIGQDPGRRHIWQKPEIIMRKMGGVRGKIIADIGAGTGYFSFRFLPKAKRVIAVDVDPAMVKWMMRERQHLHDTLQSKLEVRLCTPKDPLLNPGEVEVAFMANIYPYIVDYAVDYLKIVKKAIRPGGMLVIVDFKKKHTEIGPPVQYRVSLGQVELDLQRAGFEIIESDDSSLAFQYIVLARPVHQ